MSGRAFMKDRVAACIYPDSTSSVSYTHLDVYKRQARYYPAIHPYGAGADLRSNPQDATELYKGRAAKGRENRRQVERIRGDAKKVY